MAEKVVKARNWRFVIYPDSLPENWQDIIRDTLLPIAISPLHDKDVTAEGELKKPHYHGILCYGNTTPKTKIQSILKPLNGPQEIKTADKLKMAYRYFVHADDPDKAQYDFKDILHFNGFCLEDYVELSRSEEMALVREIVTYVRDNNIYDYSDLLEICFDQGLDQYFDFAYSHTIFFTGYIRSRRERLKGLLDKGDKL